MIGEARRIDGVEHLVDERSPAAHSEKRGSETMPVETKRDHIPSAKRKVRIEDDLLWHIANKGVTAQSQAAGHKHPTAARRLQTKDDPEDRRLTSTVRADQPGELTRADRKENVAEDRSTREYDTDTLDVEDSPDVIAEGAREDSSNRRQSFSVDRLDDSAFIRAFTSASIQDW